MTIRVEHIEQINGTVAVPLAVDAWKYLLDREFCEQLVMIGWDHSAVIAFVAEKLVGIITYENLKWQKSYWINLGYVKPDFRRQGVYTAMWNELIRLAKADKALKIRGSTAMKNLGLRATAQAHGRRETGVTLSYDVGE